MIHQNGRKHLGDFDHGMIEYFLLYYSLLSRCNKEKKVKLCGKFFLGTVWPINTMLSLLECHSLYEYLCWPCVFMATIYPPLSCYSHHDIKPCHKASVISIWFHDHDNHFSVLQELYQLPELNQIFALWQNVRFVALKCTWKICRKCRHFLVLVYC